MRVASESERVRLEAGSDSTRAHCEALNLDAVGLVVGLAVEVAGSCLRSLSKAVLTVTLNLAARAYKAVDG